MTSERKETSRKVITDFAEWWDAQRELAALREEVERLREENALCRRVMRTRIISVSAKGALTYRMFVRARFVQLWGVWDGGLVDHVPSLQEALGMVPAGEFQDIDWFCFVPVPEAVVSRGDHVR